MIDFAEKLRITFRRLAVTMSPSKSLRKNRRRNTLPAAVGCEILESKALLSVANFAVESTQLDEDGRAAFSFQWNDATASNQTTYELWVDELLPGGRRNSRVYYENDLASTSVRSGNADDMLRISRVDFDPGNYIGFIRAHSSDGPGNWIRSDFQIDDDGDSSTSLNNVNPPATPEFSVIREGQGWSGHSKSESRIGWTSEDVLHDIWLNKRNSSTGRWELYRRVTNITGASISFRELAASKAEGWMTYFGQIDSSSTDILETGDYRIFIRSLNRAADSEGVWVGKSSWSSPIDFSYQQVEGADAKPNNLTVTHELRSQISWDPIEAAEGYLVSIWKGPDYSSNEAISFVTQETSLTTNDHHFVSGNRRLSVELGDQFYVKVRGLGQDGSPVGYVQGNHAAATIRIPAEDSVGTLPTTTLVAPSGTTGDSQPLLQWTDVGNAETYEVWLSSQQTGGRVLLATNITAPRLHLNHETLSKHLSGSADASAYSAKDGLAPGTYWYWVRAHSSIASDRPRWSSSQVFTISETVDDRLSLDTSGSAAEKQIVSPSLVISHSENNRQFLLIANGRGESFGQSILAKFEVGSDGLPFRPTIENNSETVLEFPDLLMGSNVTDLKALPDGRVAVLSRGSSELRLVNPNTWATLSSLSLLEGSDEVAPDAIGLETLDNNQILVVFNRSDRLRVFATANNTLTEVSANSSNDPYEGFLLPHGRGVQVSSVSQGNGVYRLSIATPGVNAVAVYDYNSTTGALNVVNGSDGKPLLAARSHVANPFLGGTTTTLEMPSGEKRDVFLSADRSGFVTWIDSVSLQYGFIDVADHLRWADRSPESSLYHDPNENSFDSTRITAFGNQQIAVFSDRGNSLLVKLQISASGIVTGIANSGADLYKGYSGTVLPTATGFRLYSAANAFGGTDVSNGVQGRQLTVTDLNLPAGATHLALGDSVEIVVSNPVRMAHALDHRLLVQSADAQWKVLTPPTGSDGWITTTWPSSVTWQERQLTFETGFSSTWQDPQTGTFYVVVGVDDPSESSVSTPVAAVLKINSQNLPDVVSVHRFPELKRAFSAHLSESTLLLLDRRGGESVTIKNWQQPENADREKYEFHRTRESESGAIRPGHGIALNDQTVATVHDTYPDRGISVFRDQVRTTAIFHANTTGTFAFDLHRYDNDRIIMATYGGDLVIQNATTGIIELDRPLNEFGGTSLALTSVESSSYENGIMTVTSPANQTVAVFRVEQIESNWTVTPIRIYHTPNVVRSVIKNGVLWIIESNTIRRVAI